MHLLQRIIGWSIILCTSLSEAVQKSRNVVVKHEGNIHKNYSNTDTDTDSAKFKVKHMKLIATCALLPKFEADSSIDKRTLNHALARVREVHANEKYVVLATYGES
jgi:hypothetical protein